MMKIEFTRDAVLARITEGPARTLELAGSLNHEVRQRLRAVLEVLAADGLIRSVYIEGIPHWVLKGWDFTNALKLQILTNRSRRLLDGCLEWPGYLDPRRGPMACIGKDGVPTSVRRTIWQIKRGPLGYQQTVRVDCENDRCVEYQHMYLGRREDKAIGKSVTQLQRARIARAKQRTGKLDWEKVRAIRARIDAGATDGELAREYGVAKPTIADVRKHRSWREEGGMFTALIARRTA